MDDAPRIERLEEAVRSGLACCRLAAMTDEAADFRRRTPGHMTASATNELLLADALKDEVARFKRLARAALFGPWQGDGR